jgi:hypothetical protein
MRKNFLVGCCIALFLTAFTLTGCPPQQATQDFHTQDFAAGTLDLEGKQTYYMPDSSVSFYSRVVVDGISTFPVNTAAHNEIDFSAGDPFVLELGTGGQINYYGIDYRALYIGSDGTIAFGMAGLGNHSLATHFGAAQISLLPMDARSSGRVTHRIFSDSVIITYDSVNGNSIQSEFFVSGDLDDDISISYPAVSASASGVSGFSNGQLQGANSSQIDAFLSDFGDGSDLDTTNTGTAGLGN